MMLEGFFNFFRKRNEFSGSSAKTVSIAFDRKKTNSLLDSAVKFVERKEGIHLRRTEDYSDSPLLVFCINDSRLQEDINNVKRITRSGNDVMLLVVTDNTKLRLVDTDATEGFGAKHILLWDHERSKFRNKDNHTCIVWLHKFLVRCLKDDPEQVTKSAPLIRRWTSFKMITGLYKVLPPLSEELEKNAVIYLEEKHNISLLKTERDNNSGPLIILCRSGENVYKRIQSIINYRQGAAKLLVLLLCWQTDAFRNIQLDCMQPIFIKENHSDILDIRENYQAARRVKDFLKKSEEVLDSIRIPDRTKALSVKPEANDECVYSNVCFSTVSHDPVDASISDGKHDWTEIMKPQCHITRAKALSVKPEANYEYVYSNVCFSTVSHDPVDASISDGKHDWTEIMKPQSHITRDSPVHFLSSLETPFFLSTQNTGNIKHSENEPETERKDSTVYPDVHVQAKVVKKIARRSSIVSSGSHRRRTLTGSPFTIEMDSTMAKTDNSSSQGRGETMEDIGKGIDKNIVPINITDEVYL